MQETVPRHERDILPDISPTARSGLVRDLDSTDIATGAAKRGVENALISHRETEATGRPRKRRLRQMVLQSHKCASGRVSKIAGNLGASTKNDLGYGSETKK